MFIPMEDYITMYSKHTTNDAAATNLKHIGACKRKTYQTLLDIGFNAKKVII